MELPTTPSPEAQSGELDEGAPPASGGRRRIVPFVSKRAETNAAADRAANKAAKTLAPKTPQAAAPSSAVEDLPQTLVPVPRRAATTAPAAAPSAAPAPAAGKSTSLKKDVFIRSFPADVRASEVQAAGAAKGLVITVGYVHWVRSRAKAAELARNERLGNAPKKAKTPSRSAQPAKAVPSTKQRPPAALPKTAVARRSEPLDRAEDARIASAITTAAIASARMPNREASERLILENSIRWVGLDRAIELLRTAQARVGLLLRPLSKHLRGPLPGRRDPRLERPLPTESSRSARPPDVADFRPPAKGSGRAPTSVGLQVRTTRSNRERRRACGRGTLTFPYVVPPFVP